MSEKLSLVVVLHVNAGREAEFERFETAVATIMQRYGGALERRIAIEPRDDPSQPHEVHVVSFPDRAALDRYRADPDFQALAGLRAEAIRETVFWCGADRAPFGAQPA
ncbi:MAG: DUF1330 domain-containing protein [Betaproteobacteria bacterium]|nr:DUF1330 domain-containing protein [Betaproteobacteria bacterium]